MKRLRSDSQGTPPRPPILRGLKLLVLALVAGVFIAACGSSSTKTTTTALATNASATTASSSRTKLQACLKSDGVTLPSGGKGGGFPGGGTGKTGGTPPSGTSPSGGTGGAPTGSAGTPPTGGTGRAGGFFGGNSKTAKAIAACDKELGIKATTFAGAGGGARAGAGGRTVPSTATLTKFVACIRKHGYAAMPEARKSTSTSAGLFPKRVESNVKFKKAVPACESLL